MKAELLYFDGVEMPTPYYCSYGNEKIWSKNTGRGSNGLLVGDIVTIKKKLILKWRGLSPSEVALLNEYITNINRPFFNVSLLDETYRWQSYTMYAGTPAYESYSWNEKFKFCKEMNVDLIEQ
ncbi:MAG: hypothetical protein IJ806_02245 [Ruminococcus sp.]|nr:hypothetical protein [Ruminococcus sp.]